MKSKLIYSLALVLLTALSVYAEDTPVIKGWKPKGKPAVYNRQNVWDAINGAAETYVDYGLQELLLQKYENGDKEIEIEVYDQGSAINAFGIFRRERPPAAASFAIGGEAAIQEPYTCMMYQGGYLVRVKATSGDLRETGCQNILEEIASSLEGAKGSPEILSILPVKSRIAGSEGYTPINFLGITDLPNALHARYEGCGETMCDLFTIIETNSQKVDSIWRELSTKWKHTALKSNCSLHREIPYRGPVFVIRKGDRIWGATGKGDADSIRQWLQKTVQSDE